MTAHETKEPMEVRRVATDTGSVIWPRLHEGWPDIDKLAWCAGVALADSGIRLTVTEFPDHTFGISWSSPSKGVGLGSRPYREAWRTIVDMSHGAEIARAQAEEER